jgi:hypothetical protein
MPEPDWYCQRNQIKRIMIRDVSAADDPPGQACICNEIPNIDCPHSKAIDYKLVLSGTGTTADPGSEGKIQTQRDVGRQQVIQKVDAVVMSFAM